MIQQVGSCNKCGAPVYMEDPGPADNYAAPIYSCNCYEDGAGQEP